MFRCSINALLILICVYVQNPYYFISLLSALKQKKNNYFINTTRFVFNYAWLINTIANHNANYRPAISYLSTSIKSGLDRELPQHLKAMAKAQESGFVYCPAAKGTHHDGCFFDEKLKTVTEIHQFKLKGTGSNFNLSAIMEWVKHYEDLNILNIGYCSSEDYERDKPTIYEINQLQIENGKKLNLTCDDFSSWDSEKTCSLNIPSLLVRQSDKDHIVCAVNNKIKFLGEAFTELPIIVDVY